MKAVLFAIVLFAQFFSGNILLAYPKEFKSEQAWKESRLPAVPPGYSRSYFKQIGAFFLVPEGWTVQEESKGQTQAIFITKEPFDQNGMFAVGFSLNVIPKFIDRNSTVNDIDLALLSVFANMKEKAKVGEISSRGDGQHFRGYFAEVSSTHPGGEKVFSPSLLLLNVHSGTLYMGVIESRIADWDKEKERLMTILSQLGLDPDY